jgi:uncharacterized membrane-anchored protein YjiN (DUF445 family)
MGVRNPTERWALWSLVIALAVAAVGKICELTFAPFWGGLVFAFGEAALVGGLADWFAVRALFAHPFGIPFPHTAIIPRNRPRIVREIRTLVQDEWLPRSLLTSKVESFDFVGSGLLPLFGSLKPHLRELLRGVARDVFAQVSPPQLAAFLARGVAGSIDPAKVGPFLADLAVRAREQRWLEPLLREWIKRLQEWSARPESRAEIHERLRQAAAAYREKGWFKNVTYKVAEVFGGVNLEDAAAVIQAEVGRFATDQLAEGSQVEQIVRDGLVNIEQKLRTDDQFLEDVRRFLLESSETGNLTLLLDPVLASLRAEALREVEKPDSWLVGWAMGQLDGWVKRLGDDPAARDEVNAWCRRLAAHQVEQHHDLIGVLVEEQLNRLSDENLVELIEAKVGEDLNWIRLNGAFVGGLVGGFLYLAFTVPVMLMGQ